MSKNEKQNCKKMSQKHVKNAKMQKNVKNTKNKRNCENFFKNVKQMVKNGFQNGLTNVTNEKTNVFKKCHGDREINGW